MNAVVLTQNWYILKCWIKPPCRLCHPSFFKQAPPDATQQVRFCCQWAVGLPLNVSSYRVTHPYTRLTLHHRWPTPHVCWYFLRNKYFSNFLKHLHKKKKKTCFRPQKLRVCQSTDTVHVGCLTSDLLQFLTLLAFFQTCGFEIIATVFFFNVCHILYGYPVLCYVVQKEMRLLDPHSWTEVLE